MTSGAFPSCDASVIVAVLLVENIIRIGQPLAFDDDPLGVPRRDRQRLLLAVLIDPRPRAAGVLTNPSVFLHNAVWTW